VSILVISLIIQTYNREHCIYDAKDSVLDKSFKNYEIIVVDDGSRYLKRGNP
jgi:glycosyltransferase involved in cell wall biosynthesis